MDTLEDSMARLTLVVMSVAVIACSGGTTEPAAGACEATCTADFASGAGTGTEVGEKIEDITLTDCSGEQVKLSDVLCEKKLALIYYGSGWCQPCRDKMPTIQGWYEKYGDQGFGIYMILPENTGPLDPATKTFCGQWKSDYDLTFDVMIDPTKEYTSQFLEAGATYPVLMLVDHTWTIRYKQTGDQPADLEDIIKELLCL
jgi:peroxiredoxin